ncbi:MAG: phosphopyruvate hydratase [Candidatus Micrarchaeota archaeon]
MKIKSIFAREILDSRGNPTVEVDLTTDKGFGRGVAPSGASTGAYEAVELRDISKRYLGKGVQRAVDNVNITIAKEAKGKDFEEQEDFDNFMLKLDGTFNKSNLGGNAIVATSMAFARAHACEEGKTVWQHFGGKRIPQPMFNVLNGGKHAGGKLSIQEFMIMPKGKNYKETLRMASEIYHILGKQLVKKYGPSSKNVGDEGGYAPQLESCEEALIAIMDAVEESGYKNETTLCLDSAASSFYDGVRKTYLLDGKEQSSDYLLEYYLELVKKYPIVSIEDPFDENDFDSFAILTKKLGKKAQVVGDDLLVTNPKRIKEGIEKKSCNSLLLKLNQIGTVTEALHAAEMCRDNKWTIVVSHRSGETEDAFIADFSVGINSEYIKTGSCARGERTAKYNQLLRIFEAVDK